MALSLNQQVRLLCQDNTPGLYIISDDEIDFLLERNNNNVDKAVYEALQIMLRYLAQRGDESIDIFSIRGSKSAEQMRLAIELYLKDPANNPLYKNLKGYVGGVSISDMDANNANLDNNIIQSPSDSGELVNTSFFTYTWRS